jgi:O-antigen ligase
MLFAGVVLLEVGCLSALNNASGEDVFGLLVGLAMGAPFVLLALALEPRNGALAVPFLVIVPVTLMRFTLAEAVLLVVVFMGLLQALASGRVNSALMPAETLFFFYTAWAALTISQAVYLPEALGGLKRIIVFFLAFLMGARMVGSDRAVILIRCIASISILCALELWGVFVHSGYPFQFLATRAGILTNLGWGYSNYVAAVAALCASAGIPLALYGRGRDRLLGIVSMVAAAFVCMATVSRGGTLVLGSLVGLALLLEMRHRFGQALVIFGGLALAYVASPLGAVGLARFVEPGEMVSVGARLAFYQESFNIFREHPFLGVGPNQIPYHTPEAIGPNPHNMLLKNGADFGIPGLLIYLAIFAVLGATAWKLHRRKSRGEERILPLAFVLVIVAALINSAYEPTLEGAEYGIIFWVTSGSLAMYARNQMARPESI